MIKLLKNLVFPKYCVACQKPFTYLCAACATSIDALPLDFAATRFDQFESIQVASTLSKPVSTLIHDFKYQKRPDIAGVLADIMLAHLDFSEIDILTYVPADPERLQQRGFDHLGKIGIELRRKSSLNVKTLLYKTKHTLPQQRLDKAVRQTNLKSAYSLLPKAEQLPTGLTIGILDDAITTGATFTACQKELAKLKPKKMTCFAIAHTIF